MSSACALAVVFAAVLIAISHVGIPHAPQAPQAERAATVMEAQFTAMPYVVPPAPYERTAVVRTEVSLQIMQAAGFQVHGGEPYESTLADVLYGEDGRILALRLIPQPTTSSDRRMD